MSLIRSLLLGERIYPTGYYPIDRGPYHVLIREDAKGLSFTDVNVKAALSPQLFPHLWIVSDQGLNPGLPAWKTRVVITTPHTLVTNASATMFLSF